MRCSRMARRMMASWSPMSAMANFLGQFLLVDVLAEHLRAKGVGRYTSTLLRLRPGHVTRRSFISEAACW